MSREQFSGMVVAPGSPHNGKQVIGKTPFVRLVDPLMEPSKPTRRVKPTTEAQTTSSFIWVHTTVVLSAGEATWGFWIPDGKDLAWLLDELQQGYWKGTKK